MHEFRSDVTVWGTGGREFKSRRSDQLSPAKLALLAHCSIQLSFEKREQIIHDLPESDPKVTEFVTEVCPPLSGGGGRPRHRLDTT